MKKPVYVIDAMNYIFRAYHSLPDNIVAPSGMLTNAVLGYLQTLLRIIKERKPEYMAAAFERDTSFRKAIFAAYKANDVIGTIAMRMSALGHRVVVVTGDKDMSQLVCESVHVYDIARQHWLDEAAVREKFGVAPSQI